MTILAIRDLDAGTMENLRAQAAQHGWSPEDEVRAILEAAACVAPAPEAVSGVVASAGGFGSAVHALFAGLHADDIQISPQSSAVIDS